MLSNSMVQTSLQPGFRFHPTDVELVSYYLKRKVTGKTFQIEAISEVDLYKFAPWDLPAKSPLKSRDLEWYFFCPRDRKYGGSSSRRSRCNEMGYWKTTGKDRPIIQNTHVVGMKKTLIFHSGKAPRGDRTNWVMYEYRLDDKRLENTRYSQDAYVVCKIFEKSGRGPKNWEQYGAPLNEEEWEEDDLAPYFVGSFAHASSSRELPLAVVPEPVVYQPLASIDGQVSSLPELSDTDGILLEELAEFLNSSPIQSGAGTEMSHSLLPPEYEDEFSGLLTEGINHELDGLSAQVELRTTDNIYLSDINREYGNHPIELNDLHLLEENNTPELLIPNYLPTNDAVAGQAEFGSTSDTNFPDIRDEDFFHSVMSDLNDERFLELNDFPLLESHTPTQPVPNYLLGDGLAHYPTFQNVNNIPNASSSILIPSQPMMPSFLLPSTQYLTFQGTNNSMASYAGANPSVRGSLSNRPEISRQPFILLPEMGGFERSAPSQTMEQVSPNLKR